MKTAEDFLIKFGYDKEDWGVLIESPMDFFDAMYHTSKALKEVDEMTQRVGDIPDLDGYEQIRSALIEALNNITELVNHYRQITNACLVAADAEERQTTEQQTEIRSTVEQQAESGEEMPN